MQLSLFARRQLFIRIVLLLLPGILAVIVSQQSFAQKLEEIIVTAQERAESLQDVSVSVTALSGEKLADFGIARLEEITAYTPNFVMSETGIGTNIYIRGIGSGINQGFEQSVGMYRDGIYYGRAQLARAPIFDMERVEVLRGPQVTLFGNNSIGGAISMKATSPSDEFEGSWSFLSDFDHGEQETTLILSGPVTNTLAARLSIRQYDMDGYLYNQTVERDEPNRDYLTTRLNLSLLPESADWFSAGLLLERSTFDVKGRQIVVYQDLASKGYATATSNFANGSRRDTLATLYAGLPTSDGTTVIDVNDLNSRFANNDFSNNETGNATLTLSFNIGESEIKATSGYLDYNYDDACDCDFTGATLIQYESDEDYEQHSQEIRYISPLDKQIEVIAGLYYQKDELLFNDALIAERGTALQDFITDVFGADFGTDLTNLAAPRHFEQKAELFSAFGQATMHINDDLRLIAGVRRSRTEKEAMRDLTYTLPDRVSQLEPTATLTADQLFTKVRNAYNIGLLVSPHIERGERKEWRNSYTLIAEWDISEDVLAYFSKTRGFKAGGFDVRSNNPTAADKIIDNNGNFGNSTPSAFTPGTFEFEDEEAIAHELGVKALIGEALEINTTYFYTEIKDLQVSVFDGGVGFNVSNAAEAVTQGVEIDFRAALTDYWSLNGSLAWLDFEFKDYKDGLCTAADKLALNGLSGEPVTTETLPGPDGFFGTEPDAPPFSAFDNETLRTLVNGNCTEFKPGFGSGGSQFTADLTGSTNQYVANYSGALSLNYTTELKDAFIFRGALDVNFTDDYNPTQNIDPSAEENGYEIYNLRLSLASIDEEWELVLLGRNIFDETVITYANDVPLATSQFGTITKYGFVQRTKSWAIQGRFKF